MNAPLDRSSHPVPRPHPGGSAAARLATTALAILLVTCAARAQASPIEYYRYTLDRDGDTTAVIIAAYDTVAMQLMAEIQQSPLGTAVQTEPLYWASGHFVGTVSVAVTGPSDQLISLTSAFDRLPSLVATHSSTLTLDVAMPTPPGAAQLRPDSAGGSVTVKGDVKTEVSGDGEKTTTAVVAIEGTVAGAKVIVTGTDKTTTGRHSYIDEKSLTLTVTSEDEGSSLSIQGTQGEDAQGNPTSTVSGSADLKIKDLEIAVAAEAKRDVQGTESKESVKSSYKVSDATSLYFNLKHFTDLDGSHWSGSAGLDWNPSKHLQIHGEWNKGDITGRADISGWLSVCLPFTRQNELLAGVSSAPDDCLHADATSASCWPDTNSCLEQPVLMSECPLSDGASYEVAYDYSFNPLSFDPLDPYSIAQSMQVRPVATPLSLAVGIGQGFTDAFPASEIGGLPGTVAFDTCAAYIQTGINRSQTTGNTLRFNIPGDSVVVVSSGGDPDRVDLVFRILPGPGNFVVLGNRASGLRRVPTSPVPATAGDGSFWGQYLADNGAFGSVPGHMGNTWKPGAWNSARCDTAERNLFPVDGRASNLPNLTLRSWMTTYHESDPKFATLGILKNRCFLIDTLGVLTSPNITCSTVPAWLSGPGLAIRAGYDGSQQTREFTKSIPDGLLTAGSHVEYFFRSSRLAAPAEFVMCPDTNVICPQTNEGPSFDGHRWQQFGILPDRWKDAGYGGIGAACLLAIDYNDGHGDERVFISLADSIGMSTASKFGAHNGWHCTGAYVASDGTHDYTNENVGGNPTIAVSSHGGQPGTTFDLYQVKAAELSNLSSNGIGARLANRSGMGLADGKFGRQAPTPEMLRAYYKLIYLMSGGLNARVLGPVKDRGSNDVAILEDFLSYDADALDPRGVWVMGNGFVESEYNAGGEHEAFLTNYMACGLRDPSYYALSGSSVLFPDLLTTSVISSQGHIYAVQNAAGPAYCALTNDVLYANPAVPGATAASYYQNLGSHGPYIAGVYAPSSLEHPYVTLVDGYDLKHLRGRYGNTSCGRQDYFMNVLVNVFGSVCPFTPAPTIDVPENTVRTVDFLNNVWGNPVVPDGVATVHFGLAKADRVEVKVYDVTGRLVRILADRDFPAGEHSLTWNGTDDNGHAVSRGVYFTQARFLNSHFVGSRKLTVLR